MINIIVDNRTATKYLKLLELPQREPDYNYLSQLVAAHLTKVPFENISKLYYKKKFNMKFIPDLEQYLEGIEKYNFGGTCYSNNVYLNSLLKYLGFDIKLCGADMNNPDVHIVSIVNIESREYIIDVGYAAPFYKPIPRDSYSDHKYVCGNDSYIIKPQNSDRNTVVEQYRNDEHIYGYVVKPTEREFDFFSGVIKHSFRDEATFMNSLLVMKFYPDYSITVRNFKLLRSSKSGEDVTVLPDTNAIIQTIVDKFQMPFDIVSEAVNEISEFGNPYS